MCLLHIYNCFQICISLTNERNSLTVPIDGKVLLLNHALQLPATGGKWSRCTGWHSLLKLTVNFCIKQPHCRSLDEESAPWEHRNIFSIPQFVYRLQLWARLYILCGLLLRACLYMTLGKHNLFWLLLISWSRVPWYIDSTRFINYVDISPLKQ